MRRGARPALPAGDGDAGRSTTTWQLCRFATSRDSTGCILPRGFVDPCIPTLAANPTSEPERVHKIKHYSNPLIMRGIPRATNVNSGRGRDPSERPLSDSRRAWRAMCTVACGPHSSKKGSMLRQPLFGRSTVLKPAQRGAMVDPSSRLGDRSHSGIGNVRACARFGRQSGGILPGCA